MKKLIYFVFVSALAVACSSEPRYVVKGNIEGSDSITFYLQKREAGKTVKIDSAVSKKGTFTLKGGKVDYPQLVQLVAGNTNKRTSFYIENSQITVTGKLDSLYNANVTGSKTHDEYKAFVESNKPLSASYQLMYGQYQAASQAGDAANVARIEKSVDSIQNEMTLLQKSFVKDNPSSYVTPSILQSLSYEMEPEEIETVLSAMDTVISNLPQMQSLKERVAVMKWLP